MKRTDSFEMEQNMHHSNTDFDGKPKNPGIKNQDIIISKVQEKKSQRSQKQESSFYQRKTKIPKAIKSSIIGRASGKKPSMGQSRFGKFIKDVIIESFNCGICEMQYKEKQSTKMTNCDHRFCDSCLQHYVIYKVGMFEEVVCPQENCDLVLETNSDFFKNNLPKDICKKYEKVHAFYLTAKNPNLRLCPNEGCENGILHMIDGVNPMCSKCEKVFCAKCMFPEHPGVCDNNEVNFFENNLHYRQCRKCKNVIERSKGCNHMTCICKHEFCYLCGGDWSYNGHICAQNRNRNNNNNEAAVARGNNNNNDDCCDCCNAAFCCGCYCGNCCDCGDDCCECLGCIGKTLLKIVFIFPLFLVIFAFRLIFIILPVVLFFILSIFAGITGFACQFMCDQDNFCVTIILFIFYPICMIIGIGRAFGEIFCEAVPQIVGQQCQAIGQTFQGMLLW